METKEKSTKVMLGILALAGLVWFCLTAGGGSLEPDAPPGPTMKTLAEVEPRVPIHAADLPLTITEPNSYYLAEHISFEPNNTNAITIECNDVTIDLMGYTLKGPDSGTKCGIYMSGRTNVEIRNGTVRDFYYGIREAFGLASQHRVINVRAISNEYYGIQLSSRGNLVKDCTVADNGGIGIQTGAGSTVTGNTAYSNGSIGISAGDGSTVTANTAYSNGNHGIYAATSTTVTNNTAQYNQKSGFYVSGCCTVTGNTAYYNNLSDDAPNGGIRVYNGCLVKSNTAGYNKQNNIYVAGGENAIEENLVTMCSLGNGINLSGSGSFYANNRASGNATDFANTGDDTDGGGNAPF